MGLGVNFQRASGMRGGNSKFENPGFLEEFAMLNEIVVQIQNDGREYSLSRKFKLKIENRS